MNILSKHEKIALQFSGGKDSIACLLLLKEHLHKITVFWLNTGDPLPETLRQIERVKAICPNFIEVKSNQEKYVAENGWPVDLLPIRNHPRAQALTSQSKLPLQGFLGCCFDNIMFPLHKAAVDFGATLIIRGQKLSDHHKSPVKSGDIVDGIEYLFPIENWDDKKVLEFIEGSDLKQENHAFAASSLDCWSCTAYRQEHKWQLPYLGKFHPEKASILKSRLILIKQEIESEMQHLEI